MLASMFAALLGLGLMATASQACLNDRETKKKEMEFKSQYNPDYGSAPVPLAQNAEEPELKAQYRNPAPRVENAASSGDFILLGMGSGLGIIGVGIGFVALRKST
jgi:hypothetical protein